MDCSCHSSRQKPTVLVVKWYDPRWHEFKIGWTSCYIFEGAKKMCLLRQKPGDPSTPWPRRAFSSDRQPRQLSSCLLCIVLVLGLKIVLGCRSSAPCRTFLLSRAIVASSDLLKCGSSGCSLSSCRSGPTTSSPPLFPSFSGGTKWTSDNRCWGWS